MNGDLPEWWLKDHPHVPQTLFYISLGCSCTRRKLRLWLWGSCLFLAPVNFTLSHSSPAIDWNINFLEYLFFLKKKGSKPFENCLGVKELPGSTFTCWCQGRQHTPSGPHKDSSPPGKTDSLIPSREWMNWKNMIRTPNIGESETISGKK